MNQTAKGAILVEGEKTINQDKLDEMATALATDTAAVTATFLPFFGVAMGGEGAVVAVLQADPGRSLMVGQSYEFTRPFEAGERVSARVFVEDVYQRGANEFATVVSEFRDTDGGLIQRQRATFIEMARPAPTEEG